MSPTRTGRVVAGPHARPVTHARSVTGAALVAALVAGGITAGAGAATAADDTPVALAEAVSVATTSGTVPDLPAQVEVGTASGGTRTVPVDWQVADLRFDRTYATYAVAGDAAGLAVSAAVEVVPGSVEYFVDSGPAASTPPYAAVAAVADLRNDAADRRSTAPDAWGYVNEGDADVGARSGDVADKDATGWWARGRAGTSRPIVYRLPLDAGTHTVTLGFEEWWSGPRQMKVSVVAPDGTATVVAPSVTVSNASATARNAVASGTVELAQAGTAQVRVEIAGGTEAPVVSWLAVAAGEVAVDTTPFVVEAPTITPGSGLYPAAQEVSITAPEGATVRYTTDGTVPTVAHGTRYTGPFTLATSATVRAVAVDEGVASPVARSVLDIEPVPADGYDTVPVGRTWYDTDGNPIQAHGGGFLEKDGWYYWVGENKSHDAASFLGVSLYRSQDLVNWEYVKDILTPASHPELADCKVERPKLLYNDATDTFVLWGHWETADSYAASHLVVATSSTVDGDYTFLDHFRPGAGSVHTEEADPTYTGDDERWGYGSRDFTVFTDPDTGQGYLVGSQDHLSMRLYPLTDDYTGVDWEASYPLFEGERREAPAVAKIGDRFVMITSGQSGWYPNQAYVASTTDITDPDAWSDLEPVGNNTTYYSQPTNIMSVTRADGGTEHVYMGDRWDAGTLGRSTYVWLPLEVDDDGITLDFRPTWSLDTTTGAVSAPTTPLVSEGREATSSAAVAGRPASAAVDGVVTNLNRSGDSTNYFQPTGVPFTWQVDLGEVLPLDRVDLAWRSWNGSETYARYTVLGSVDGVTWERVASRLDNTTVGFTSDELAGAWRHVRVAVEQVVNDHNGNDASWAAGLVEVQVYAAADAWERGATYDTGDEVTHDGSLWRAGWWTRDEPGTGVWGSWQEIATDADGVDRWTPSRVFDTGDVVRHDGVTYRARWWTRNQEPGSRNGPWQATDA
ncbi:Ig-like protein group 4 [Isoptericola jiangsuensis]|uniref:Ig-like protein group 4 n=1 Tax=Isoptericola jiangsuensis TaxID=548579 RepID=A0A2A9EY28_9MICO|nr:chitobiase/beta-hexosaminidase C-terminal domain-containing protein [Isoptericola jiangsuensis]PFG43964.1 Ig-like protein group 4 [Isoptericola jiangsuensis]